MWKSKHLSNENIKLLPTSEKVLTSALYYNDSAKIRVKFDRNCLKQNKVTFTPRQY